MTLKTLIADDVADVFMDTDEMADSCTYLQGSKSVSTTAIVSESVYETFDEQGFPLKVTRMDFLMPFADLNSAGVTPRSGDRIERTVNSYTHAYEVAAVDKRQPVELDVTGNLWLIHTKRVSTNA